MSTPLNAVSTLAPTNRNYGGKLTTDGGKTNEMI